MTLDELVNSVNIIDYIAKYIQLTEKGGEWWGLSCFTDEKTPSFSVKQNPPIWYDFSSGKGGNILTFIMQHNKCSKDEAIEILKQYVGYDESLDVGNDKNTTSGALISSRKYAPRKLSNKESIGVVKPNNFMSNYEYRLDKMKIWLDEGISREVLDNFQVRYDPFSDRLVYPIRNLEGKIVNVGGRTLDPDWKSKKMRKYTYFFPFGTIDLIYGLYENLNDIKESGEIILFEGCKSVMKAKTWGYGNTGAILTSHLNKNQFLLLIKLGVQVTFALDREVDIYEDKNIRKLKDYLNVKFIYDRNGLLDAKDSPVDKGKEVFDRLYNEKLRLS